MDSEIRSKVELHYDRRANTTKGQRAASKIILLRKFQNWVKATLINTYAHEGCVVLDLACGKGGDVIKWSKARSSKYYGYDISRASIEAAKLRSRSLYNHKSLFFDVFDCFGEDIEEILPHNLYFNVVSVQFALHYSFENEERARWALHNISVRLEPNGYVIGTIPNCYFIRKAVEGNKDLRYSNGIFSITFDSKIDPSAWGEFGLKYNFSLADALDNCPEYVVYWRLLVRLASEYGLELVYRETFHKHYYEEIKKASARRLFRDIIGCFDAYSPIMSEEEWDVAGVYYAFAFRKTPTSNTRHDLGNTFTPDYE